MENKASIKGKNKIIFCTCTKSGCKLKYCECVKYGRECTDLCRCLKCKNSKGQTINNKIYKVCYVNSICIIDNEISLNGRALNDKKFLNKKRAQKGENISNKKNKSKKDKESNSIENQNYANEGLFDENGKMIFKHINLNNFKNF